MTGKILRGYIDATGSMNPKMKLELKDKKVPNYILVLPVIGPW